MSAISNWLRGIDLQWFIETLMVAVVVLLSISVHESSHALTALWLGDDTGKRLGRISLNPLRHIDPIGLVMMILLRFGWAKPVMVDMRRFKNPKVGMALSALAGPVSNVLLSLLGLFGYYICAYRGGWYSEGFLYYLTLFFQLFAAVNAGLAVFNLLPISPLDGSKVLAIFLPDQAHMWLMRYERYGSVILIVLLLTGALTGVLSTLRNGLLDGLSYLAEPVGRLLSGVSG